MNRTTNNALAEPFYRYRGNAIRSLKETIDGKHQRTADVVIAGIITLLLIDVSRPFMRQWKPRPY